MTRTEAARKGGQALVAKYGNDYMRSIGKRGAEKWHMLYEMKPVDLGNYAIVERVTGKIVAFTNGNPHR